jgi:hypothetical protein
MSEVRNINVAKWQVTATTINCDRVNDYVTIMVDKDWKASCIWFEKYGKQYLQIPVNKVPKGIRHKISACYGVNCKYISDYVNKLREEE